MNGFECVEGDGVAEWFGDDIDQSTLLSFVLRVVRRVYYSDKNKLRKQELLEDSTT